MCIHPKIPPPPVTPCSEVILPDAARTYFLMADSFAASFSPVTISPLKTLVTSTPVDSATLVLAPTTANSADYTIFQNPFTTGYDTLFTPTTDQAKPPAGSWTVQDGGKIITPGSVTFPTAGRMMCSFAYSYSGISSTTTLTYNATTVPKSGYTSVPKKPPRFFFEQTQATVKFSWSILISYSVDSPTSGWNNPTTNYRISAVVGLEVLPEPTAITYLVRTGNGNAAPFGPKIPWGWAAGSPPPSAPWNSGTPPVSGWMAPYRVSRTSGYEFVTTDRTQFMNRTAFTLSNVPRIGVPSYPPLASPTGTAEPTEEVTHVKYEAGEFVVPSFSPNFFKSSMISVPGSIVVRRNDVS